jgi:hypothetical protein
MDILYLNWFVALSQFVKILISSGLKVRKILEFITWMIYLKYDVHILLRSATICMYIW